MGFITGLLSLLVMLFAGILVFGIIMFIKESFTVNTENTVIKSDSPVKKPSITCSNCGQKLTGQHTFCPYCGNKQDKRDEKDVKNHEVKIETETNLNTIIDSNKENTEVIETSPENDRDNNLKMDSSDTEIAENTESDVVLNEDDVNSSNDTSELNVGDTIINENVNILEDIYQSQNKWINGDNEKGEYIAPMQEPPKDSKYKPHNKKQKRRDS